QRPIPVQFELAATTEARRPSPPVPFDSPRRRLPPVTSRLPWTAAYRPETGDFSPEFTQTSSHSFSLISLPNLSSEAPGVQLTHRRDLRRVQLARTSSRRRTKETARAIILAPDPPPKCRSSFVTFLNPVEDFGNGQNTGGTLPNFRQKSGEKC
ncbi:hypothetical protein Prudu_007947, partial [Prunus dulcis]